jgi:hypothetical protein
VVFGLGPDDLISADRLGDLHWMNIQAGVGVNGLLDTGVFGDCDGLDAIDERLNGFESTVDESEHGHIRGCVGDLVNMKRWYLLRSRC